MATVSHLTRKGKSNTLSIFIRYRHNDSYTDFNTGVKIPSNHWNVKKKEVYSTRGILDNKANADLIESLKKQDSSNNAKIKTLEAKIKDVANRLHLEGIDPEVNKVKEIVSEIKEASKEVPKTLLSEFEAFRGVIKENIAHGTYKHYKVTESHLTAFLKKVNKPNLKVDEMDYKNITDFKHFLKTTLKLSDSSANNHLNRVKRFLGEKFKEGTYKTLDFKEVKRHKIDYANDYLIYLTIEEIKKIQKIELKEGSRLDKVRDILLMACSTGLRFSDVMRLTKDRIKDNSIHISTQKNKKLVKIPLFLFANEILEKYDNELPTISNQKMNEYVKELAELAEVNEVVILDHYKGKRTKGKAFKKYELISSHTGKKTFIMLNIEAGTPIHILSEITGNNIETLKHYYRVTDETKRKYLENVERAFMKVV